MGNLDQRRKEVHNQLATSTSSLARIRVESKPDSLIFQPVAYSILNKTFCHFWNKNGGGLALFLCRCVVATCLSTCCLALGYFFDMLARPDAILKYHPSGSIRSRQVNRSNKSGRVDLSTNKHMWMSPKELYFKISFCNINVFIYIFQNAFVCSNFESVCVFFFYVKTWRVDSESDMWSEHVMPHFPSQLACH